MLSGTGPATGTASRVGGRDSGVRNPLREVRPRGTAGAGRSGGPGSTRRRLRRRRPRGRQGKRRPVAVAAALTVAPQVHEPAPHLRAAARQMIHMDAHLAARTCTVQPGDPLAGIAQRCCGQPVAWSWLYQVNRAEITGPGLISPGQVLDVPSNPPASFTAHRAPAGAPAYRPRHAAAPAAPARPPAPQGEPSATPPSSSCGWPKAATPPSRRSPPASPSTSPVVIRARSPPPATTACGRSMTIRLPSPRSSAPGLRSRCLLTGRTGQRGPPSPTADGLVMAALRAVRATLTAGHYRRHCRLAGSLSRTW